MQVETVRHEKGRIRVQVGGEETDVYVRLAKAGRSFDWLLKVFVVLTALYVGGEILRAFLNGTVARMVR